SCAAYFSATARSNERVFVGCGLPSAENTSVITRTLSPPRIGSGHMKTGLMMQSDAWPSAWFVLEPSKPHSGTFFSSVTGPGKILVFDRSFRVGSVPSTQMYSALIAMQCLHVYPRWSHPTPAGVLFRGSDRVLAALAGSDTNRFFDA